MNSPTPKRQGLALSSFVLGLLSVMCFGLFAGIPAIFLGHTAHRRSTRQPEFYGGRGLAIAGFVLGYVSIVTTLVLAGLFLPALAKAKQKAQSISCMNNMKQVGLAFRIWATDHQDRFPFNATTNLTGQAAPDAEVIQDPVEIFRSVGNQLATPRVLVCPADGARHPAGDFDSLSEQNISYEIDTSPEITPANGSEVLVRCPIHGHELRCDGSVQQMRWR